MGYSGRNVGNLSAPCIRMMIYSLHREIGLAREEKGYSMKKEIKYMTVEYKQIKEHLPEILKKSWNATKGCPISDPGRMEWRLRTHLPKNARKEQIKSRILARSVGSRDSYNQCSAYRTHLGLYRWLRRMILGKFKGKCLSKVDISTIPYGTVMKKKILGKRMILYFRMRTWEKVYE